MREAVYIGIDVAVKFCVLVVVNAAGQVLHRGRVATTELELQKAVAPWGRRAQVAIEQGELAGWVCRTLAPGVGRIVVAEPKHLAWIFRDPNKNDAIDAEKLAQLLRLGQIHEVYQAQQDDRWVFKRLVQHYEAMTYRQSVLKVQIKSQLRQEGVLVRGESVFEPAHRQELLGRVKSEAIRGIVKDQFEALEALLELQRKARRRMAQFGRRYPELRRLQTIPGFGPICACRFVAYLQTPGRFANKRKLWRYARLAVVQRFSGGVPLGRAHLDRSGCGSLKDVSRKVFQGAIRRREPNALKQFYVESVKKTGNEKHARLSTQRKIFSIALSLWRNQTEYEEKGLSSAERRTG